MYTFNHSERSTTMAEPTTSTAAAGAAGWKLIGGAAGGAALATALASIVVMSMTRPRTDREWTVAIVSTVVSSICGGAALIRWLGIQTWAHDPFGLMALFGIVFACGLPGWFVVRAVFNWMAKREGKGIDEVVKDAREILP